MNKTLVKEYSQSHLGDAKITGASFYVLALNLGLALFIGGTVFYFIEAPVEPLIVLYASIYIFFRFTVIYQSYLRSRLHIKSYYLIDVFEAFSFVAFLVILFYFRVSLFMAVTAYILRSAGTLVFAFMLFRKRIPLSFVPDFREIKVILKGSILFGILSFTQVIYFLVDQMLLGIMRSSEDLGIYAVSVKLITASNLFTQAFFISFFPMISKYIQQNRQKFERLLKLGAKFMVLGGIAYALFLDVLAPGIVKILYGMEYIEAVAPLIILGWGLPVRFLVFIISYILIAKNEYRTLVYLGIFGNVVNIILDWILIPSYGVHGVASATVVTFFVGLLLYLLLPEGKRFYRTARTHIFRPFLALLPVVLILVLFERSLWIELGLIAVIFPAGVLVFRIVSPAELGDIVDLFLPDNSEEEGN